ncbi:ComEC family competence protein, partial [bacterium]|nr:ComEC family competence protein [bacterium]
MPIVKITLLYILGIITGCYLVDLAPLFLFKVAALLTLVSLVLLIFRLQRLNSLLLLSLSLLVGLSIYEFSASTSSSHHITNFIFPKPVLVKGKIAGIPKVKKKEIHLTIKVSSLKVDNQEISPIFGLLRIKAARYPSSSFVTRLQYGEKIKVRGSLKQPADFTKDFLASQDIYAIMETAEKKITIEEEGKNLLLRAAGKVRGGGMIKSIEETLEPPSSNLLMALLLGARELVWEEILEDFKSSGTLHILAISGLHLAILAFVLFYFWQKLLG